MGGGALEAREAVKCQMSVSIELCIIFSPIPTHGLTPLTRSPEGARRQEATTHEGRKQQRTLTTLSMTQCSGPYFSDSCLPG